LSDSVFTKQQLLEHVISQLGIIDRVKDSFRPSPESIDIFLKGKTISANLKTGKVEIEEISSRRLFKESNFLYLNTPKKLWTWIADIFAASLILLAITGLFMNKGKHGFKGRGKWFALLGLAIPLIFLIIYY